MAGENDSNIPVSDSKAPSTPQHSGGWSDDGSNPFVAFRRFADEQVSSLLQSVIGLPSALSTPHRDSWTVFTDNHGNKGRMSRQKNDGDGEEDYTSEHDEGSSASEHRENLTRSDTDRSCSRSSRPRWPEHDDPRPSQSWRKWCNGPSDFFGLDSFFDRFWLEDHFFPFSSHLFHPHHRFFLPGMFEDSDSPTWPMAYIMFSPYSPLHLERHAHYRSHRHQGVLSTIMSSFSPASDRDPAEPQWREAFEDLLRLENGKPMLDRDSSAVSKTESGKDWLQGMVERGSLGDRWKYVSGTDSQPWSGVVFSGSDRTEPDRSAKELPDSKETEEYSLEQNDAETELDVYDQFLQDIESREREFFHGLAESPLLRFLLEERRRQQDELDQYRHSLPRVEDDQRNEESESWLDLVSGGNRQSVPEIPKETELTSAVESKVLTLAQPRVVSTLNRTERIRLADGSIQTKTVRTKRFADGREESDESVEVAHSSRPEGSQPTASDNTSKRGWFWKD